MVPDKALRIRSKVLGFVGSDSLASELLDDYFDDLARGSSAPIRLLDFLRGLYVAGSWPADDQDDIERLFYVAYPGASAFCASTSR